MHKIIAASLLVLSTGASADTASHWSYEGKAGPENWGDLSGEFITCKSGKFQSPINIRHPIEAKLPPLRLDFRTAAESLVNNGHSLQVTVDDEDDFKLDGDTFTLRQYHFHAPSENLIDGKRYPLEAHFVHTDKQGNMAVIAVMFTVGKENTALNPIIDSIPAQENHVVPVEKRFDLAPLFPADRHYYRFSGSLTTPPCSEGLRWLVMKKPVTLSSKQLHIFQQALKHSNNRPIQPLNGRIIVE
ncbi:TPA: carbonic anhydrase family protein [Enterobacter hormaechei subsp. xiangfangensis]|nr:carbonic anhydrase family protein [Enterobacter hormaechei subsp. xiangfangensis]